MPRLLAEPSRDCRRPAPREFLDGTDVEVAIVKELLEGRHFPEKEPAILADAVSAHGRSSGLGVRLHEFERPSLGLSGSDLAAPDPLQQPGRAMRRAVPFVHRIEDAVGLVNGDLRSFCHDPQVRVRHDRRDLDDVIPVRVQPGHFEIDPHEIVRKRRHPSEAGTIARAKFEIVAKAES